MQLPTVVPLQPVPLLLHAAQLPAAGVVYAMQHEMPLLPHPVLATAPRLLYHTLQQVADKHSDYLPEAAQKADHLSCCHIHSE